MRTRDVAWRGCTLLLLVLVAVGVHFLSRHYASDLRSDTHGVESLGLYLLYPGFIPAMFVWPGAHHSSWWAWLEAYNIVVYVLVVLLVCRKMCRAKSGVKAP
jgi:hypothetical protein